MSGQSPAIFTDEQKELAASARRFLQDKFSSESVRGSMESPDGFDETVWKEIASLGWIGLQLKESHGGAGYGFGELAVLLEEMGRVLMPAPFLSSAVFAASAISHAASEGQRTELLPQIADGSLRAAFAFAEPGGSWDPTACEVSAVREGDTWLLSGTKRFVVDGASAELLIAIARSERGLSFFAVDPSGEGVVRTKMETLDLTRPQASIDFDRAPAELLGDEAVPEALLQRVFDECSLAIAAESLGGAQRCLDMSVQYANERIAFGRPIGSFQAVKHKCANVLLEVENLRSAVAYAGWCAGEAPADFPVAASMAKAYAADVFTHAAAENIQIHGGIGFTWEHDAHLFLRRAKSSEIYLGDGAYHRELLARRLGV